MVARHDGRLHGGGISFTKLYSLILVSVLTTSAQSSADSAPEAPGLKLKLDSGSMSLELKSSRVNECCVDLLAQFLPLPQ